MTGQFVNRLLTISIILYSGILNSQVTIHLENFNAGLGTWSSVDASDATDVWTATANYMEVNGIGGGDDIDWLISPAINMDIQTDEFFLFDYNDANAGDLVELLYSTNYNNGGTSADVNSATWINIPLRVIDMNATSCITTMFQRHPAIDIDAITGTAVFFAFRYTGTSASARRYRIDNVHIDASYFANITNGIDCEPLKNELHGLISTQTDRIRYTSSQYDVWDALLHTDTRLNDAGTATIVWDMFTDIPSGTGEFEFDHCSNRDNGSCPGGEGICYNREHTFPRSWWGGGTTLSDTINTDMHHLYASDRSLNSAKSNYPPGNVLVASTTGSNGFLMGANASYPCTPATGSKRYIEPIDEFKGDYARTFFYLVTRYQHNLAAWAPINSQGNCFMDGTSYPGIQNWALQTLLQWHVSDPVSQKEINHNNAVYAIQGNWNPFISSPGYVYLIWGDENGTPCDQVILPIELLTFNVKLSQNNVVIDWKTASELDNDYFLVERSLDLIHWKEVAHVDGAGTSSSIQEYTALDIDLSLRTTYYYRLKQVDLNGGISYSESKSVFAELPNFLNFYPNPVSDVLTIKCVENNLGTIEVSDPMGRSVMSDIIVNYISPNEVKINMEYLSPNIYLIKSQLGLIRVVKN